MTQYTSREWHLVRRPEGVPTEDDVRCVEASVPELQVGQVLIRTEVMSVEPYMRGLMEESSAYGAPYGLNEPMRGRAIGTVERSRDDRLPEGTRVQHPAGWRERAVVAGDECTPVVGTALGPDVHLGALGNTGFTAWVGLTQIAAAAEGETVFVSSAAGGVGSIAVQLAKLRGCRVIASAGGAEKVRWVEEVLGADAAFDHRDGPARASLRAAMERAGADGLDVYFDNVGGEQLEAAIRHLNTSARVVLCGMISLYNRSDPAPGPRNLIRLVWTRSRMEGFLIGDWEDRREEFHREVVPLLESGELRSTTTVAGEGIGAAFGAFLALLDGGVTGKAVVDLRG